MTEKEFATSRFYRPKVLNDEECSQDPRDMREAHERDIREQYEKWVAQREPDKKNGNATVEEDRVVAQLAKLTNSKVVQPVVQRNKGSATKKDAKWWKEYRLRNKQKVCVHCGKDPRK